MIEHDIDPTRRLLTCRATGRMSLPEITEALNAVAAAAREGTSDRALVLVADMPAFLACSDLRALRPIFASAPDPRRCSRWAVVVPNKSAKVMGELVFRILHLDPALFSCFLTEEEARIWLGA